MKKKTSCLLMLAVLGLATACGRREEPESLAAENRAESQTAENQTAENQVAEWIYVPEFFTLEGDYIDYGGMLLVEDSLCYISME